MLKRLKNRLLPERLAFNGVVASGGTVTEYTGDGTNGVNGQKYRVHTFTASGTLTVTQGGDVEAFVVSGGAGLFTGGQGGSGGQVWEGKVTLPVGSIPVTVGLGGQQSAGISPTRSQGSSLGTLAVAGPVSAAEIGSGSGSGTITLAGVTRSYDGTAKEFGKASTASPRTNSGDGSSSATNGAAGIVIVRYPIGG